ncbi:MAG: exosortase [Thermodesulfobacteriota bacterium]|nr:exosortase [Thermodesulfobacteriota bacterium]
MTIWLTVILVTSFVIAYFPVWRTLVLTWYGSEQYSHGFLVVPIFIYILLTKKDKLSETPVQPSLWGLGLVILSSLLYLFAHFAEIVTVSSCSIVLLLIGIVVYLYGARMLKELAFPLFFLLFMIPIPSQIYATLTIPLQLFVSKASAWLAMLWGVPLYREGNIIHLPDRSMQIVQACSGLRSMASLLALSVLLAYFMLRSNLLRVALFLSGIPTAIIVNIVRVLLLVVVFHYCNLDLTARALHTVFGLFIFLLALLIMIAIRGILSHWDKRTIET